MSLNLQYHCLILSHVEWPGEYFLLDKKIQFLMTSVYPIQSL